MSARVRPSTAGAIVASRPATSTPLTHKGAAGTAAAALRAGGRAGQQQQASATAAKDTKAKTGSEPVTNNFLSGLADSNTAALQQVTNDPVAIQEETQRIEDRLHLIEVDSRTFYDRTGAEQRSNREEINRLRAENKEMKTTLTNAKRGGGNVLDNEIRQLDSAIYATTMKLDRLNDTCAEYENKIRDQKNTVGEIEKNSRPVLVEGSALDNKIRTLENRLDKTLIKYNEAVSIRKTYQQILKRLKEEQVGFDNQLAAIEKTLAAKSHDYQELLNMSHQANAAKEAAKKELQDFQQAYAAERIAKDDQLAKKKAYVQSKADQTFKLERREKALKQKEQEAARHEMEEEQAQQAALAKGQLASGTRTNTDAYNDDEERLAQYEAAFKTIKDATGVSDVNDLLQKYINQEETRKQLQLNVHESQAHIDRLQAEIDELTTKLDELRYSGSGQLGSRRIIEEFEVHLNETRHLTATNGQRYEAITKLLISAKAGIEHLIEITQAYRYKGPSPVAGGSAALTTPDVVDDDTAIDALKMVEQKLLALADEVVPTNNTTDYFGGGYKEGGALTSVSANGSYGGDYTAELPANNTRVRLAKNEEDLYGNDNDDMGTDGLDDPGDDAVLKREQVKKISVNAIQRETKKLKRRRK